MQNDNLNFEKQFSIDDCIINLVMESTFFAELSRQIRKVKYDNIPTIGVSYDPEKDDIVMYWNENFMKQLSKTQIKSVLTHEFYHLVFQHLTKRKRTPHMMWNIATDLAINSLIMTSRNSFNTKAEDVFPRGAFVPGPDYGVFNTPMSKKPADVESDKQQNSKEFDNINIQKAYGFVDDKLFNFICSLPILESSEFYFDKLKEFQENNPEFFQEQKIYVVMDSEGDSGQDQQSNNGYGQQHGGFDTHESWDKDKNGNKINEQLVKQKIENLVQKAAEAAEKRGWGNIPSNVSRKILETVAEKQISWKDVLRNFISSVTSSGKRNSLKRINRKYPYTHAGTIRNRVPRLLIALDESGSISDTELQMFFKELEGLTKLVSIDVIPFDCSLKKENLISWRKGQRLEHTRKHTGGTDFNAPTEFANSEENRNRWDAMIIFTDGAAPKPISSRVKRAWAVIPTYKLYFETDELVIKLDNNKYNDK